MNRPVPAFLTLTLLLLLLPGCFFRPDERTITIDVPGMKVAAGARAVEAKLNSAYKKQSTSYIQSVKADHATGKVVITYFPNNVATLNLLHSIGDAGFDARFGEFSVKGDPVARKKLPPECQ